MGPATTFMGGKHHVELQSGVYGCTLAKAFYKDPMVVFERFRIKTEAGWGAGHVDHSVQSRLTYKAPVVEHTPEQLDSLEEKVKAKRIKNDKRIERNKKRIESLSERRVNDYKDSVLYALKGQRRDLIDKRKRLDDMEANIKRHKADVNDLLGNIIIKF